MATEKRAIKRGDDVILIEKPDGHTSRHYALTVGKTYRCLDFDGSNIITTTDEPGETANYGRSRVRLATEA